MASKRFDIGWLLCLVLFLPSCGNDASVDAVVSPATQTSAGCTFNAVGTVGPIGSCQTVGPVQFHVQRSADDATPVGDANIRIDIGNSVGDGVLLLNSTGTACFNGGNPAVPDADCFSLETRTDKFGNVSFQVLTSPIEGCDGATQDITSSTFARVTISNSSGNWQMDTSIKCS